MTATLTVDRATQFRDLADYGYCLVEDALTADEVARLRGRLIDVAQSEIADDTDYVYDNGCNQRVFSLLNKGECFVRMAQHPLAMEFAEHVLAPKDGAGKRWAAAQPGPHFLLSNIDANIAGPGGKPMGLHYDQLFAPQAWHTPLVLNIAWMLDDFTEENGATRVIPGSHLSPERPEAEAVPVCGPAGSAMVFEGRLWHQTGANVTKDEKRHGLFTYYCAPYLRQQENHFVSLDRGVLDRATPVLRRLLGYEPYLSNGSIDGMDRDAPRG